MAPPAWISLALATLPHSAHLGRHRAPSCVPCAIQQFSLAIISRTVVCMSVLLPQSVPPSTSRPVSTSLFSCLHLYSCPANRFISTVFLDSLYMQQYMIFVSFFLTYFTLCNRFKSHLTHYSWLKLVLFYVRVTVHCIYVSHWYMYQQSIVYMYTLIYVSQLYPFICQWRHRLSSSLFKMA